jgi:hypothetical protein
MGRPAADEDQATPGHKQPYSEVTDSGRSMALSTQCGYGVDSIQSRVAGVFSVVMLVLTLFSDDLTGFE